MVSKTRRKTKYGGKMKQSGVARTGKKRRSAYDRYINKALQPGDAVEVKVRKSEGSWSPAKLVSIDYDDGLCDVEFRCGEVYKDVPIAKIIVSLRPHQRQAPWNTISDQVKQMVEDVFVKMSSPSPNAKGIVRKWLGYNNFISKEVHYLYTRRKKVWEKFQSLHPDVRLGYSTFKRLTPWYVRKGKRDTCLCGVHENISLFLRTFNEQSSTFYDLAYPDGNEDHPSDPNIVKLYELSQIKSKSGLVDALLCKDGATSVKCVDGNCTDCGIKELWSNTVRSLVVALLKEQSAGTKMANDTEVNHAPRKPVQRLLCCQVQIQNGET